MDENFMTFVPPHRTYINYLINKGVIDMYAVSMESQTCWITLSAESKTEVDNERKDGDHRNGEHRDK